MRLDLLHEDIEAKPSRLLHLAHLLKENASPPDWLRGLDRVVILGMGSSRFAADRCARQLRRRGFPAWADYSTAASDYAVDDRSLVVLVSASGRSRETLAAGEYLHSHARTIAITNGGNSPLASTADIAIDIAAGPEQSGVVTRSMIHTHLVLDNLTDHLTGASPSSHETAEKAAEAVAGLLDSRPDWLPEVDELLDGDEGPYFLAPAHRLASARQSALLVREVPRMPSAACETHDWPHIDVYLTKTTKYRAVMFGRTNADTEVIDWITKRGSVAVSIGEPVEGVTATVRFKHDSDARTADMVDTVVAELLAATWAARRSSFRDEPIHQHHRGV